jgi:hypothetical protein
MKKLGIIVAVLVAISLIGCGTGGGGGGARATGGAEPFIVDLSTLPLVRNPEPLTKAWDDVFIPLPAASVPSDMSGFNRVTITADYFTAGGDQIPHGDANVMVTLVYDPEGDWRGPSMGPGPNTPVKEFNVGGFSGMIHRDRGVRVNLRQAPGGVLLQNNSGSAVAFIELTSLVFHSGNYSSE